MGPFLGPHPPGEERTPLPIIPEAPWILLHLLGLNWVLCPYLSQWDMLIALSYWISSLAPLQRILISLLWEVDPMHWYFKIFPVGSNMLQG